MNRNTIKKHILLISTSITSLIVVLAYFAKPDIMFNRDGTIKKFGLGNNSKTIVPLWYLVILASIMVYGLVRFYLVMHRL